MRTRHLIEALEGRRLLTAAPFLFDVSGRVSTSWTGWGPNGVNETIIDVPPKQPTFSIPTVTEPLDFRVDFYDGWSGAHIGYETATGQALLQASVAQSDNSAEISIAHAIDYVVTSVGSSNYGFQRGVNVYAAFSVGIWVLESPITARDGVKVDLLGSTSSTFTGPHFFSNPPGGSEWPDLSDVWTGAYSARPDWYFERSRTFASGVGAEYIDGAGNKYIRSLRFGISAENGFWTNVGSAGNSEDQARGDWTIRVMRTGVPSDPVAKIEGPTEAVVGRPATFISRSYDPDDGTQPWQGIRSHLWMDGEDPEPDGTGLSASYTWTTPGPKTITLQVTDNEGMTSSVTKTVNVVPAAKTFDVVVRTFIPQNYLWGPPVHVSNPISGLMPIVFKGDGRGYDLSSNSYRTMQRVTLVSNESADSDGIREGSVGYGTGQSESYLLGDVDLFAGQIRPGAIPYATGRASDENMRNIEGVRVNPETVRVRMAGSAGNPIVPFPVNVITPTIDWDLSIVVDTSGKLPRFSVEGTWDGFPAIEVFINGVQVLGSTITNLPVNYFAQLDLYNGIGTQYLTASGFLPPGVVEVTGGNGVPVHLSASAAFALSRHPISRRDRGASNSLVQLVEI